MKDSNEDLCVNGPEEDQFKKSYAILNSILEGPENIIAFSLDCNYQYIFFNQAHKQTMKAIWGKDIEIGTSMMEYIAYPEDREKARINFDRALSGENFIVIEEYGDDALSRNYWENIYTPVQSDNKIIGLTVFCIDITERQRSELALKESEAKYRLLVESAKDPIYMVNRGGIVTLANKAACQLSHLKIEDIVGKGPHDLFPGNGEKLMGVFAKILTTGEGVEVEIPVIVDNREIWFSASLQPYINPEGNIDNVQIIARDITKIKQTQKKLKKALKDKDMLLKEIYHRVKNNLMVISSLLNIQSRYIKDKAARDVFRESQNRAKSMALIHERLYRSTDLKNIDFGAYIRTFATELYHSIVSDPSLIKLNLNVEPVMLDINTSIPLGLIVNELITNSLKHAFPDGRSGEINIDFTHSDGTFVLSVADNGVGLPENLDFKNTDSLGLQLVNSLTDQIDGKIELDRTQGTRFKVIFKEMKFSK